MKVRLLFFIICTQMISYAQINESFNDGDFTKNPEWVGNNNQFKVNDKLQLQSTAITTSVSALFTNSESIKNAEWNTKFIINYTTSASNYAAMYIISDNNNLVNGCNGYFVQVGGTNDEVSLFLQQGTKKTKIIDGTDKRIAEDSVNVEVKVTRDEKGNFKLWTKKSTENEYVLEGETFNDIIKNTYYFGLLYSNTSTTGNAYIFDDIIVKGEKSDDTIKPSMVGLEIIDKNILQIIMSEKIKTENLQIEINNAVTKIEDIEINSANNILRLKLNISFETGIKYEIKVTGIKDYSENFIENNSNYTGIPEEAEVGDIIWNEVMFNNAINSAEYVEIYNRSDKIIEMTNMYICTRKTDGTLNTGNKISSYILLFPNEYLAITTSVDSIIKHHNTEQNANIIENELSTLNNTSATIVLCNNNKEIIYDELKYDEKWHHTLIKNTKGVALEKIHPDMETQNSNSWHSAGSTSNYGTPGYKNSQYNEINNTDSEKKIVWIEKDNFSPNNNGNNDLCIINYKNDVNGYISNIKVLNTDGIIVYELANNRILQSEDYIIWDGKTKAGKVVNPGIYIIYFEAIHHTKSQKIIKKIPIAVTF